MKQKTFRFEKKMACEFEDFCKSRMLVESRVGSAAVLSLMELSPEAREQVILRGDRWTRDAIKNQDRRDQETVQQQAS